MALPPADTPLYNHPLPEIEAWLARNQCQQDRENLHCWRVERPDWQAELFLEEDRLTACYCKAGADGQDIRRSFQYSLSRNDIEDAVFAGP